MGNDTNEKIGWRFPPLCGGSRQGYTTNDIEAFKGEELIDNLAREICQNSLDAKREGAEEPVKVVFELKSAPSHGLKVFDEYRDCIEGCCRYWGNETDPKLKTFLDGAKQMLSQDEIPILVAGDYQTSGLSGSHSKSISSSWEALTGSNGVSVKPNDTSAGSFGVGKNAPFACSALSMVFYKTYANDGGKAFVGVGRLATLDYPAGTETQAIGKYQVNDNEGGKWQPIFEEDADEFRDMFPRNDCGTDVIIVGFSQSEGWMDKVEKAVLKNFFVAVIEGKLEVELKDGNTDRILNADTISREIDGYANDGEMVLTSQLYKAFTDPGKKEHLSIIEKDDAELYIRTDSSYKRVIANFRDTGMLIGTQTRRLVQHYAAVFVVRGQKLGGILRAAEPARHNKWDSKLIEDAEKRKEAGKVIKSINGKVLELLKSQFEEYTETTVDAAGVAEYIPDSADDLGGAATGNDLLRPKVKIGKETTRTADAGKDTASGKRGQGSSRSGKVHNGTTNPNPKPDAEPSNPVTPGGKTHGIVPGRGSKTITAANLLKERAYPVAANMGVYKIIIVPEENYDNLYIKCSAQGEDGKEDSLTMKSFKYSGGEPITFQENKAGPIRVEANVPSVFYANFENNEKMVLKLEITEEVER